MGTRLNAALDYADRLSWPVIPCNWIENGACSCKKADCTSSGKHPLTNHGVKDWTCNPETIRKWWAMWPQANIGIPTGAASGVDVLDIDPRHYGNESLDSLIAEHGPLEETVEQITGGGGRHVLFRHVEGIRNAVGVRPGLDIRGEGGYFLVAPSSHASGRQYEWELSSSPGQVKMSDWPGWLLALVRATFNGQPHTPAPPIPDAISEGKRNDTLTSLAGTMRRRGMTEKAIFAALMEENAEKCHPPLPNDEVRRIARSVAKYPAGGAAGPSLRCLADVKPEPVEWLWYPRIPVGRLTMLEGDPGEGKSFLSLAIATALSMGHRLPEQKEDMLPGNSLIFSCEDGLADTIRPRLDEMGADVSRIFAVAEPVTLDDIGLETLDTMIRRSNARLVILDPITAFLAGLDLHRANEVRKVLASLAGIAERNKCAILIVRHLAKGNSTKAIYRGLGSIDFTAASRSVFLAGHDQNAPNHRAMVHIKANAGPQAAAIGYSLENGRFQWTGVSSLTSRQLLGSEMDASELEDAKEFLRDALAKGTRSSKEIFDEAMIAGITPATLRRARKALGVEGSKKGFQGAWTMELPDDSKGAHDPSDPPKPPNMNAFDNTLDSEGLNALDGSNGAQRPVLNAIGENDLLEGRI